MLRGRRTTLLLAAVTVTGALAGPIVAAPGAGAAPDVHGAMADLSTAWSQSFSGAQFHMASPTVADIDGDGTKDIVIAGLDGQLRVYDADGRLHWQRAVIVPGSATPTAVEASVTVGDLDGDGAPELVVGAVSGEVPGQQGGLVVFDRNGNVRWRWHTGDIFNMWNPGWGTRPDGFNEGVISTPAIGDVDGDGAPDIVFGAFDNQMWALHGDGTEISGFPYWVDDSIWSSPALYDADGDGRTEVYIGVATTPGGPIDHAGGAFIALDWDNGQVNKLWQVFTDDVINSSPAIADLDNDGTGDVVVGTGLDYNTADSNKVFAWRASDGRAVSGWPRSTGGATSSSPAIGDVNGDGHPDVVSGSRDGKVWAWKGDGTLIWSVSPNITGEGGGEIVSSPVIADLDGNGRQDVVIGNGWGTFFLRGSDGGRLYTPNKYGFTYQNAPAVAEFGDRGWRLVLAGFTDAQSHLTALRIPTPGIAPAWPMWRNGPLHDGNAAATASCPEPVGGAAAAPNGATTFTPLSPVRVLDSRRGLGTNRPAALAAGCTLALQVTGNGGVPSTDVTAVTMNVTVTRALAGGYLTVYPCGQVAPLASNLNYTAGQTVPNLVTVAVGAGGKVCFFTHRTVHLVADVAGWYGGTSGARFHPVAPARVLDTRTGNAAPAGKVAGATSVGFTVTGREGVPATGVSAVILNVTATEPDADGYLTVYPCGQAAPEASNLNYLAGQSVPNQVVVPVGSDGRVCVYTMTAVHVIADIAGWYGPAGASDGSQFRPLTPERILDTRTSAKVTPGQPARLVVAGAGGVPSTGAGAVTLNVTVTEPDGGGYLTVYPCGGVVPVASNLNFVTGQTVPNLVTVPLGPYGDVCFDSYRPVHVIADVSGWFGN
ncbi:MAG: FG-GAP repeat domain-containing protein [Acidimicrobiia bacterium]